MQDVAEDVLLRPEHDRQKPYRSAGLRDRPDGLATVSRAFLAVVKSPGFGPFSQLYERLHTVLGSVDSSEGISGILEYSWIWSFLAVL